jgi:hypothetical protein
LQLCIACDCTLRAVNEAYRALARIRVFVQHRRRIAHMRGRCRKI